MIQRILLVLLFSAKILVVLVIIIVIIMRFTGKKETRSGPVSVEITKGQGVKEIAQKLHDVGVLPSKTSLYWLSLTKRKPLQAGIYRFEEGQSTEDIYTMLASGSVYEEKITIPEGWRTEQIAQLFHSKGLVDYEAFMSGADGKEGTLFPDTYRVAKNTTAQTAVDMMVQNYTKRTQALHPTPDQLILASIVEREAKNDEDRPLIASVFYNRIKVGMKLESDVTVEYGLDSERLSQQTKENIGEFTFWTSLKAGESKTTKSTYNTYKIPSLPPTPICNPGLKSIEATLNPAPSDNYFFLADKDGKARFATTKAGHDDNIRKYLN